MLKVAALEALRNPHQVRILLLLRTEGALRFNQIQRRLGLNPAQVDRALHTLHLGGWIVATTLPDEATKRGMPVEYSLMWTGRDLVAAFDRFVTTYRKRSGRLSPNAAALEALYAA